MVDSGTLWIVATPVGTLADLGERARDVLATVDRILVEDTRRARTLLSSAGVAAGGRVRSFHEHNEAQLVQGVIEDLEAGLDVALISDAGTPCLSDPGFVLVREARSHEIRVCSVPGPSAFTAALAASGQPPLPATLVGFLPPRSGRRRRRIAEFGTTPWTLVIFLSPHRLSEELADLAAGLGEHRPATLLAEISKLYERASSSSLGELAVSDEAARPRGEYVLVIAPEHKSVGADPADRDAVRAAFEAALATGADRRQALKDAAAATGVPRREVYAVLFGSKKT